MGLFDFLNKENRRKRALDKAIARLTNPYMQGPERMRGAEILLELGGDDAIYGLLKRFTITSSNTVVDQDEKEQVYHMVVDQGEAAVPAIERFIRREDQIFYALRALSAILDQDRVVDIIGKALDEIGTDYMRNPERKLQMIQHLAEIEAPKVVDILIPFLEDHDMGVRFQTVNALYAQGDERAREPMLARLCSEEEESLRLRKRILEVLAETGWPVTGFRKKVEELLPKGFSIDKSGKVKINKAKLDMSAQED